MLNLASETSPGWLERALADVDTLLVDHAHCEKKAAGNALRLLFNYPHVRSLQEPLSELAREELVHFEQVLALLDARGVPFRPLKPAHYGRGLHGLLRGRDPDRLVDILLVSALIEARSCERFRLLADRCEDSKLAAFYRRLLASEARHHHLYVDLAEGLAPRVEIRARLAELAASEAEIVAEPSPIVRMHAG